MTPAFVGSIAVVWAPMRTAPVSRRDGPLAVRAPPVSAGRLAVSARTLGATWRRPLPPPPNTATAAPPPPQTTTAPLTGRVSQRRLTPLVATRCRRRALSSPPAPRGGTAAP